MVEKGKSTLFFMEIHYAKEAKLTVQIRGDVYLKIRKYFPAARCLKARNFTECVAVSTL
jgi:hypothetical protein